MAYRDVASAAVKKYVVMAARVAGSGIAWHQSGHQQAKMCMAKMAALSTLKTAALPIGAREKRGRTARYR